MSPNRRILLNIVATYGRSLYALVCGLFTARWVYLTLGQSDYGLYGVVGGLTVFIAFINNVLGVSVGRFYAYSVGRAKILGNETSGLEECRQWFNTAVVIHTIVPLLLMVVGYPIGDWAVRHFLTIPPDRVESFVWIFRFSCIACFWSMVSVPFYSMYTAKQFIAELTVYSFAQTTVNVAFLYYMAHHPGDWLVRYGIWTCLLSIVPSAIVDFRACLIFPECRFDITRMKSRRHLKELGTFAGWYSFGMLGNLCRFNALPVLLNKYFGPAQNASLSIANTVASHTQTLSASLKTAFQPAIANSLGADETDRAVSLMHRTCKFGTILVLVFCIPVCLEIEELLRLWLKTPPENAPWLTIGVVSALVLDKLTTGHFLLINSKSRIAEYQLSAGLCLMSSFPIAWFLMACGVGVCSIVYATNAVLIGAVVIRVVFVERYFGVSPRYWSNRILLPILVSTALSTGVGLVPSLLVRPSIHRCFATGICSETVFIPLVWWFVLDKSETDSIKKRIKCVFGLVHHYMRPESDSAVSPDQS